MKKKAKQSDESLRNAVSCIFTIWMSLFSSLFFFFPFSGVDILQVPSAAVLQQTSHPVLYVNIDADK